MNETPGSVRTRFTALSLLVARGRQTFIRFPLVILSAVGAAIVFHHLIKIDFDSSDGADPFWPIVVACTLGISLFFSLRLFGESRDWSRRWHLAASLAGLAALVGYYLSLPVPMKQADVFRFLALATGLHLWVAFAPFLRRAEASNAFWQYNKMLFLRIALAALYSGVLYIGLTLAILSANALLDLDLPERIYAQLWFWIVFVYNTWFFLAGIPDDVRELERLHDYPTGLRIFTQFVLIPLVVIYLLILYIYLGKIVIEWELPHGWVGYPVIGFSVTGILALLLVHPVRERAENAWIVTYGRFFYWALFPLIGLIAVAIGTRIADYGITERRYAVVVATAWLFGIALYYTLKGSRDIKLIPVSLCLLAFLSAFGPWGATAVSWQSQTSRLRELLITNEVLIAGSLEATPNRIDFAAEQEISNILKYLYDTHGLDRLRAWYAEPERLSEELHYRLAMEEMGLRYRAQWERAASFSVNAALPNPTPISGFDYEYRLSEHFGDALARHRIALDSLTRLTLEGTTFHLTQLDDEDTLSAELAPVIRNLHELAERGERADPDGATLHAEDARFEMLVYLIAASGAIADDTLNLSRLDAHLLIRLK